MDKFCYLGDMLSVGGDADAAVEVKIPFSVPFSHRAAVDQTTRPQVLSRHPCPAPTQQFIRTTSCQLANVVDVVDARSLSLGVAVY